MNPEFPVYIISKGRWDRCLTARALDAMKVLYYLVIERHEYDLYAEQCDPASLLIMPEIYLEEYETCDDLGNTKSKGPGAARNFCWNHSLESGAAWHWVMDDNISWFYRWNQSLRIKVTTGAIFKAAEDFVLRYENIAVAGLNYRFLCAPRVDRDEMRPPYYLNNRVYSCLLIRNDIPYRWRGRYNEDTDLCLRVMKDGWCTLLFNAFLCGKVATQTMKGGNTAEFYSKEGTLGKSEMLVKLHPDVTKLVFKFNRWHHEVNYHPFWKNELRRKAGLTLPQDNNEYGMCLKMIPLRLKA